MGCKLSVSVVHPESIVNKIKESMSPTSKRSRKMSDPSIKIAPDNLEQREQAPESPGSSVDIYKTIYIDSP